MPLADFVEAIHQKRDGLATSVKKKVPPLTLARL
jgi:hypothetical protein